MRVIRHFVRFHMQQGIEQAASNIEEFRRPSLSQKIGNMQAALAGANSSSLPTLLSQFHIDQTLLISAASIKKASAQIDVVIHTLGIMYSLPLILEPDEVVQVACLGADNSGGDFDLETDRRVAEFKFIAWQDSGNAVRNKTLFEDYVKLALYSGPKHRFIYLLDLKVAQAFLGGRSSVDRILDRNARLHRKFIEEFGSRYSTVGDFCRDYCTKISLVDLGELVPDLCAFR